MSKSNEPFTPKIITDGGPWAFHNMPCCVLYKEKESAVLDLNNGIFYPSWKAKQEGWELIKIDSTFKRKLLMLLGVL